MIGWVLIGIWLACSVGFIGLLVGTDLLARRRRKTDAVDEHHRQALRALAAADGLEAAEPSPLLVEIYAAQTRYRYRGIYGEDGQP